MFCYVLLSQVFQLLELPAELEDKKTNRALLLTERRVFLETISNQTELQAEDLVTALEEYEVACSEASAAGIDIVSKAVTRNILQQNINTFFITDLVLIEILWSPSTFRTTQ